MFPNKGSTLRGNYCHTLQDTLYVTPKGNLSGTLGLVATRREEAGVCYCTRLSVSSMPVKFLVYYIVCRSPEGRPSFGVRQEDRPDPYCSPTSCLNSAEERGSETPFLVFEGVTGGFWVGRRAGQATKPNGSPKMHDPQTRRANKEHCRAEIIALLSVIMRPDACVRIYPYVFHGSQRGH